MKVKGIIMLALVSFIWGTSFVAQSLGADMLPPFTFNGVRCIIGGIALLPCIWFLDRSDRKGERPKANYRRKDLLIGGLACGIVLFVASTLQQIGIRYTTAGKTGFITAFYIVFVPVICFFMKKQTGLQIWLAVGLAFVGLYFLCVSEEFVLAKEDMILFLSALVYAVHIMVIDHFTMKAPGVKMSCLQFFVAGGLSLPVILFSESPKLSTFVPAIGPLLYAGVLSCGVAYTLQIIGQRYVKATVASLILSMEACFSVLAGWLVLKEYLSPKELLGCLLMFGAILIAQVQLPSKAKVVELEGEEVS
ncbi:DMT family transporter [Ohessyouella blattaphilus]|uniref:DMT family transporter n=1 Tax=Ohessyouella blattaphilus TaxID=2949333 RepID=A0ABT1EHK5_9FIRM|nr:DMT family transporter [Ohessyouella blattaphilus]MCP1110178.1 DMT family transporter [Ohessyouella blattaphilus]MCR8563572.1 DMT family transporter [Ohessyouella blattaphilus]